LKASRVSDAKGIKYFVSDNITFPVRKRTDGCNDAILLWTNPTGWPKKIL